MSQLFNTNNPGIGDTGGVTLSEGLLLSNLDSLVYAVGDILYIDSGGDFQRLPIGNVNQLLTVTGGLPAWGRALTVNNTAPSSPAVNDLWVDTA